MVKRAAFDVARHLSSAEAQEALLNDALATGSAAYVTHALGLIARVRGASGLAKAPPSTREAVEKFLTENGDPRLTTLMDVTRALGISLTARARGTG